MSNTIKIAAVGDICLGDHYFSLGHGTASKCFGRNSLSISPAIVKIIQEADIGFCNIEAPLSTNSNGKNVIEKSVFRGHPAFSKHIIDSGFTLANIANNHICQHGEQAFYDSVESLQGESIAIIGHCNHDKYSSIPHIQKIRNKVVGFVGYSLVPEAYMPLQKLYASSSEKEILSDIKKLSQEVDAVIVSIHAGKEGIALPQPEVIHFYRQVIDAGANIVLGHHPHVFQPIETWNHGVIAYSLGDFVFDLFWDPLLTNSAVLVFEIHPENKVSFDIYPTAMRNDYSILPLSGKDKESFLQKYDKAAHTLKNMTLDEYQSEYEKELALLERKNNVSKALFFLRHFLKGNIFLKSQFIAGKCINRFFRVS